MTFYEYLIAINKDVMAEYSLKPPDETPENIQLAILQELKNYFFIGGMPECVKTYRDTSSMVEVFQVQSEILSSYSDDFSKYKPHMDTTCIDAVLLNVAKSIGEQLKYSRMNDKHSGQTNRKAFDLLTKANIIYKISAANPAGIPLGGSANPKKFKASLLDIGLLQRICKLPVDLEYREENLLSIYRGKLAEQFVAQEILAKCGELYYWSRDARGSSAEVDYLTVHKGRIYPIEVKSGAGGSMKSMHMLLNKYGNCPEGIILYSGTFNKLPQQKLRFMPLYSAAAISA
jgi:predicted AAA+ superfamily ATPase